MGIRDIFPVIADGGSRVHRECRSCGQNLPTDTAGYNYVKIFDPPGGRNCSRAYSRQYEADHCPACDGEPVRYEVQ